MFVGGRVFFRPRAPLDLVARQEMAPVASRHRGLPPHTRNQYAVNSKRFGEPAPALVTFPAVEPLMSAVVTVDGLALPPCR